MSINIIEQTLTALTVFPQRSSYTDSENASNEYAAAVEGWLNKEQTFNADLIAFRGQLNTSIEQFNTHFLTIDDYVASATLSAGMAEDAATFCAGISATLAEGTINDSATTLTTAWSSSKLYTLFMAYDTALGQKLNASSYTASDVLAKIKTVDGPASGLDADLLDGKESATAGTANTVALRDANGDLTSRAFITTFTAQSTTPSSTVNMFYRDADNIIKPLTATAFKAWLDSIGAVGMKIKNQCTISITSPSNIFYTLPFTITNISKVFISVHSDGSYSENLYGENKRVSARHTPVLRYSTIRSFTDEVTQGNLWVTSSTQLKGYIASGYPFEVTLTEYE